VISWNILSTNSVDNFVDIIATVTKKPNITKSGQFV